MKILIYGLQSSGASLFTYFLGQRGNCIAIPDIWSVNDSSAASTLQYTPVAPMLPDGEDAVVKCVVTSSVSFEDHCNSYKPDRSILFLRDPVQNYESLRKKGYRNDGGPMEEKFPRLDYYFEKRGMFDLIVLYEEFVSCREATVEKLRTIGWPISEGDYNLPRKLEEIVAFNCRRSSWCKENYGPPMPAQWGTGNIKQESISKEFVLRDCNAASEKMARRLAPTLTEFYDDRIRRAASGYGIRDQ